MKSLFALFFVLSLAMGYVNAACSCKSVCPKTEDLVWTLDSANTCIVLRNKCYFDKENKHRKPPLTIVTKKKCQEHCRDICPQIYQPVYGWYNGTFREFGNACMMSAHSCRTGETFV